MGNSICTCSLIYFWVPSSCFCIDQPLSEGEIIPFSGVCQVGEAALSTPEAWVASFRPGNFFDVQPTTTSSSIIRRASFSALASANSFVYFASSAATSMTHLHVSNCRVRQLQFSGIFVALGFVVCAVIPVMINSPWQADDDADNQSGDNRGDSAHTSISLTVPPASFVFAIRLSALARTLMPPAPGSEAQILLQRSIAWRISPRSIIGKAPRSLICCNASILTFRREVFQVSCLQWHPTNGKSW